MTEKRTGGAGRGQGRKLGSINKEPVFDAEIPPIKCDSRLKTRITALAKEAGKPLTTWLREYLKSIFIAREKYQMFVDREGDDEIEAEDLRDAIIAAVMADFQNRRDEI